MKHTTLALLALLSTLIASGCRRDDWRDLVIVVPGLEAVSADAKAYDAAMDKIEKALLVYDGVSRGTITWDANDKTRLIVRFDSLQVAEMNLRKAIEEAGFKVVYPDLVKGAPAGYINARKAEAPRPTRRAGD